MTGVRPATSEDLPAVRNVLDGAALQVDHEQLPDAVETGDVLVAVTDGRVLGALVLDGREITAVAVRRRRRDQDIGTALVDAAADRRGELVAECARRVAPFWRSVGFDLAELPDSGRLRGRR
jgi:N-acetylglutamate synthase-like GNAT family acetyltransferase